jgi:hypothetical protein
MFLTGDSEIDTRSTVLSFFEFDRVLDYDEVLTAHDRGSRNSVRATGEQPLPCLRPRMCRNQKGTTP